MSFNYNTGQYLPDWHPWEDINDFYVSNPETGGCKEIVPFELTWINDIFGYPVVLSAHKDKLSDMPVNIDDIYIAVLKYPENILGVLNVDVLARPQARREMYINFTLGQLYFDGPQNLLKYQRVGDSDWKIIPLAEGTVEENYINPEEPYINEIKDFIRSVDIKNPSLFPNNLLSDCSILDLLVNIDFASSSSSSSSSSK